MAIAFAKRSPASKPSKKPSNRKSSWVMLSPSTGYTPLPGETTLYQSPPRTTLSLQSLQRPPTYTQHCKSGIIYLTNRRIIYLPLSPTPSLQSFSVPILHVSDSHVTAPWFGPNKWEASIVPVAGGNLPAHQPLSLVVEFKEGGAFDFATIFERLRERLKQAVEVAGTEGRGVDGRTVDGRDRGVDYRNVHLEDLPRYEERGGSVGTVESVRSEGWEAPREAPPGYEEVQRGVVQGEVERRLREGV